MVLRRTKGRGYAIKADRRFLDLKRDLELGVGREFTQKEFTMELADAIRHAKIDQQLLTLFRRRYYR